MQCRFGDRRKRSKFGVFKVNLKPDSLNPSLNPKLNTPLALKLETLNPKP